MIIRPRHFSFFLFFILFFVLKGDKEKKQREKVGLAELLKLLYWLEASQTEKESFDWVLIESCIQHFMSL